ncbi:MAG: hypothetical protein MI739_05215 [Bacteroidales bacterium]|nr:hypothetical protein [Bacteroidales bacterium]
MEKLFEIEYLPDNTLHYDIRIKLRDVKDTLDIDSYYLKNDANGSDDILICLQKILEKWQSVIQQSVQDRPVYLIIDFSDQYFGGFCFELKEMSEAKFTYGIIKETYDMNMESVIYDLKGHEFIKLYEYDTTIENLLFCLKENIMNLS